MNLWIQILAPGAIGGTKFEDSVGSATATGQPPTERSTAQGTWRYEENGVYSGSVWFFRFRTDKLYAGASRSALRLARLAQDAPFDSATCRDQNGSRVSRRLTMSEAEATGGTQGSP